MTGYQPPMMEAHTVQQAREMLKLRDSRPPAVSPRPTSARGGPNQMVDQFFAYHQGPGGTWNNLHGRSTASYRGKELPTDGRYARSPRSLAPRPLSPRNVPQYSNAYSPRQRPLSARTCILPSPWASNFALGLNLKKAAAKAEEEEAAAPGEEEVAQEVVEEKKRGWGELPPGVTPDDVRKCAGQIKEKLLDKFGQLTKAFRAIDEDGSGTVTRAEFERFLEVINLNRATRPEVMEVLFEMIDADSSDSFDFKEFTRIMNAGDVFSMGSIASKVDGYELERQKKEAEERAALEFKAKSLDMTVEEYLDYYKDMPGFQSSEDMAQVARDRWGKKIKGPVQAHAG